MRRFGFTSGLAAAAVAASLFAGVEAPRAQQGLLDRDPAVCGGADAAFAEAAEKNAKSLQTAQWTPFGTPETGWETYLPLLQRELGTQCGASTPATSEAARRAAARPDV